MTAEAGEIIKPFPEPLEPPEPAELPSSSFSSGQTVAHGQKRSDDADHGDSPKRVKFADAGFSALERTFLLDDTATGERPQRHPSWMKMQSRKVWFRSPAQTYHCMSMKMIL